MNQLVRMSQIGDAETVEEPSADLRVPFAQSGAFVCKYISDYVFRMKSKFTTF